MTQDYQDLDALVGRLKRVAAQLPHQQESTEPPAPEYHQALQALSVDDPMKLGGPVDPQHPAWHELMAADLSDEAFIERAYRTLVGREADSSGLDYYGRLLPRAGRFYALAAMLMSDEARDSMRRRGVAVRGQRYATLPLRAAGRLGTLGRIARPVIQFTYRVTAIAVRPSFRRRAQLSRQTAILLETRRQFADVIEDMDDLRQQQLVQQQQQLVQQQEQLRQHQQRFDRHDQTMDELQRRLDRLAEGTVPALFSALHQQRRAVETLMMPTSEPPQPDGAQAARWQQDMLDAYYLAFEDACRGSEAQIFAHLRHYQPQLDQARQAGTRALDLGCGRGEWLRLLADEGFEPHGIDLNTAMIDHCREQGLSVSQQDAIGALRECDDASLALVSAFHIAEHLPFDALYTLVSEAQRALAPGGVLILETPNPENVLVGSHTFYHDPTHRNPLTPTAMTFLLQYHGFADVEVLRFNPYPEEARVPGDDALTERVNGHLCGPQDFAVVGCRVSAVSEDAISDAAQADEPASTNGNAKPVTAGHDAERPEATS
ncbi:methyltransferase domain-containing protein [Modicisalibacter tunisiensis]|uniref:methyltransferase domain-containing protein n=1 Tax=Modicisalibacter tunisiensis TaxID=390637 RepID=UPI001CCA8C36|nr:methyltransferase domain-containing protein [Modicisalibacter tunisiensis]MBZ9540435.1 methyltransferase domain-containing protein [Modicisalibacter tunisiensis]